jgi:hypothetical protein
MEAMRILDKRERVDWDYDEEGDVLFVGLTILGVRARLSESLKRALGSR